MVSPITRRLHQAKLHQQLFSSHAQAIGAARSESPLSVQSLGGSLLIEEALGYRIMPKKKLRTWNPDCLHYITLQYLLFFLLERRNLECASLPAKLPQVLLPWQQY